MKDGAIVASQVSLLQGYLIAIPLELLLNPLGTLLVGLAVHGTGTKGTLCCTEGIGRVGIELDADCWLALLLLALLGGATCAQGADYTEDIDEWLLHFRDCCTKFITRRKFPPQIFSISPSE